MLKEGNASDHLFKILKHYHQSRFPRISTFIHAKSFFKVIREILNEKNGMVQRKLLPPNVSTNKKSPLLFCSINLFLSPFFHPSTF